MTVVLYALHFLCLVAMLTTIGYMVVHETPRATWMLIATAAATAITWFIALLCRRSVLCPLCKGTPMIESGALLHHRARRYFPFSHGISNILSILLFQRFRCMYCGSDYDLLKKPGRDRVYSNEPSGSQVFNR